MLLFRADCSSTHGIFSVMTGLLLFIRERDVTYVIMTLPAATGMGSMSCPKISNKYDFEFYEIIKNYQT